MEVTNLKISVPLDDDYEKILSALQEEKKKVTAKYLGNKLGIHERTVRYRLEKLRKKGLLKPPKIRRTRGRSDWGNDFYSFRDFRRRRRS